MACVNYQNTISPNYSEPTFPSYIRARRPALLPSNCSLSLAEAQELVRTQTHQPLFPPPDPNLLRNVRSISPNESDSPGPGSPTSTTGHFYARESSPPLNYSPTSVPPSAARHARYRTNWIKARAHFARDRSLRSCSPGDQEDIQIPDNNPQTTRPMASSPKRKHSAFVVQEELKCLGEARVDTPHPSGPSGPTRVLNDEGVLEQPNVEELRMVAALETSTGLMTPEFAAKITSDPVKTS